MPRSVRIASLAVVLGLAAAGCVQKDVRNVKTDLIESDSDGRSTVIDMKIEKYEGLVSEFPKEPRYRERLARLYWMKQDHQSALAQIAKARSIDPGNPKYAYLEGTIYAGIGNYRQAEASFQKLIQTSGQEFTGPYLQLAEICLAQEREEEAIVYLRKCTEIDPRFPSPYYYMGRIELARRDPEKAVEHFEQYLRLGGGMYQEEVLQTLAGLQPQFRLHHIR